MPRAQNKVASHRRRKKLWQWQKGYWGARSKVLTVAKHHIDKGLQHAYRDRKLKKREFRSLWIIRIMHSKNARNNLFALDSHA